MKIKLFGAVVLFLLLLGFVYKNNIKNLIMLDNTNFASSSSSPVAAIYSALSNPVRSVYAIGCSGSIGQCTDAAHITSCEWYSCLNQCYPRNETHACPVCSANQWSDCGAGGNCASNNVRQCNSSGSGWGGCVWDPNKCPSGGGSGGGTGGTTATACSGISYSLTPVSPVKGQTVRIDVSRANASVGSCGVNNVGMDYDGVHMHGLSLNGGTGYIGSLANIQAGTHTLQFSFGTYACMCNVMTFSVSDPTIINTPIPDTPIPNTPIPNTPIPNTPTLTPILTPVPNPTLTSIPNCPNNMFGDANCDGVINAADFLIWKCEFIGGGACAAGALGTGSPATNLSASFDRNNKVDLADFEIWRGHQTITQTMTICPVAGVGCDYVGGDGIQQAINEAPMGSVYAMTTINIKAGSYSRQVFSTVIYDDVYRFMGKYFLDTKDKYLILKGEHNTTLDGEHSVPMNGIITNNGYVVIDSLIIRGFKEEPRDTICRQWETACSNGNAIAAGSVARMTITNNKLINNGQGIALNNHANITIMSNEISGNAVGINANGQANAIIKNNIIANQWSEGVFIAGDATAIVINNTLYKNAFIGLHLASTGDPTINVRNNSITDNAGNISNPGIGIWQYVPGGSTHTHSIITYNLLARNAAELSMCSVNGVCTGTGFVFNQDPKYENAATGDFHLQSGSPAKELGDPSIANLNNTRSDMGAYGGPCAFGSALSGCTTIAPYITPLPTSSFSPTPIPTNPPPAS